MEESHANADWLTRGLEWLLALLVVLVLAICLYVVGYFAFGERSAPDYLDYDTRTYGSKWQAEVFCPGAWVESQLSGHPVHACWVETLVFDPD